MKIVFMGTPHPAAFCLQTLINAGEEIVCTVSQPDSKKGRGLKESSSPVKQLSKKYNIPVETPDNASDPDFIRKIESHSPDLIVVVAYGKILPKKLINTAKRGAINLHTSLLPKYRGAAPIQWAIINGEKTTGITIMAINEGLDTGDIILQKEVPIKDDDTSEILQEKLFDEGAPLLLESIKQIKEGREKRVKQEESKASYAPLIKKETGEIDWSKDSKSILNKIRGLLPWPKAYTFLDKKILKIWEAEESNLNFGKTPGTITVKEKKLFVSTGKGSIILKTVQLEGRNKMPASDFLLGQKEIDSKILSL